ncbi:MAG: cell division protein FtsX [Desulfovibrionaceae bacterium]
MIRVLCALVWRGVADLRTNPWAQALTLAAVTLVAFLSGLFLLFLYNLDHALLRQRGEVSYQIYWRPGTDLALVREQWAQMDRMPYLAAKKTFTPDTALESLAHSLADRKGGGLKENDVAGMADLAWFMEDNPLPCTALLSFAPEAADMAQWSRETSDFLANLPGVESVHRNTLRADLGTAWAGFSRTVVWPLIGFLGLVLALVVGNTIKLALLSRKAEMEILHLVGAKAWYIRLPLLVGGGVQGLVGSSLALGMLKVVQLGLHDMLNFAPLFLRIDFLPVAYAAAMVVTLTGVGVLSSLVAVRD